MGNRTYETKSLDQLRSILFHTTEVNKIITINDAKLSDGTYELTPVDDTIHLSSNDKLKVIVSDDGNKLDINLPRLTYVDLTGLTWNSTSLYYEKNWNTGFKGYGINKTVSLKYIDNGNWVFNTMNVLKYSSYNVVLILTPT